jgi:hypothetical protein
MAKWRALYPCYRDSVFKIELNESPGLIMPYVASIPMDARLGMIPQIRKELGKLGWAYKKTDLRWRHIGFRMDDMGDKRHAVAESVNTPMEIIHS